MNDDESISRWNVVADDWVAHADTNDYRNHFLMPRLLTMLGDVRGRRVLDLGCGEGGYVRELARRGARVTGVDGSERLIAIALDRAPELDFRCANANALQEIGRFELVIAAMSLMDVEDLPGAVREIHRVLEPGGELVMSISHPCFTAPLAEWERDRDDRHRLLFFKVDRYFDRAPIPDSIAHFRAPVLHHHRPLEDYIGEFLRNGFALREFVEPVPSADEMAKSRRFAKIARIPYFLFMRWRKAES